MLVLGLVWNLELDLKLELELGLGLELELELVLVLGFQKCIIHRDLSFSGSGSAWKSQA